MQSKRLMFYLATLQALSLTWFTNTYAGVDVNQANTLFEEVSTGQSDYGCYKQDDFNACVKEFNRKKQNTHIASIDTFNQKAYDKIFEILVETRKTSELEIALQEGIFSASEKQQQVIGILYDNYLSEAKSLNSPRNYVKAYRLIPSENLAIAFAQHATAKDLAWSNEDNIAQQDAFEKTVLKRIKDNTTFSKEIISAYEPTLEEGQSNKTFAPVVLQNAYRSYASVAKEPVGYLLKAFKLSASDAELNAILAVTNHQKAFELSQTELKNSQAYKQLLEHKLRALNDEDSLYYLAKLTVNNRDLTAAIRALLPLQKIQRLNTLFALQANHLKSVQQLPAFFELLNRCTDCETSGHYQAVQKITDFGNGITTDNLTESIEYRYVLKHIQPTFTVFKQDRQYGFKAKYGDYALTSMVEAACQYSYQRTEDRALGFFEGLSNAIGNHGYTGKRTHIDVYQCQSSQIGNNKLINSAQKINAPENNSLITVLSQQNWSLEENVGTSYVEGNPSVLYASDIQNLCLGASGGKDNWNFCYGIKDNDLKNVCLGMTKYPSSCYGVGSEDMKNFCLSGSGQYRNSCYGIKDNDLKNACLGISKDYHNCYSVNDGNLKLMCMGIANTRNSCYGIK